MFSLKYNEVSPPSFLKITGVDQYLLPEIEHYETSVTGSYGDVDGGVRFYFSLFNAGRCTKNRRFVCLRIQGNRV